MNWVKSAEIFRFEAGADYSLYPKYYKFVTISFIIIPKSYKIATFFCKLFKKIKIKAPKTT